MPKRKHEDLDLDDGPPPSSRPVKSHHRQSMGAIRLKSRFEDGVVSLARALKTARGFERQKLGRREKTAKGQSEGDTLERIRGEITFLKTLDLTRTAQKYLFKQLAKTKRIAESPFFIEFRDTQRKQIPTEGPRDTAEANVCARLYKSNPVKNVLPGIMDDVKRILKIDEKKPATKGGKQDSADQKGQSGTAKARRKPEEGGSDVEVEEHGDGDVEMGDDDAGSVDLAQFDSRLASGSEDEDEEEVEVKNDGISDSDDASINANDRNHSMSISRSPSPPPRKSKSSSKAPATSTTFLPSLTMGGYWSGSDSGPSDAEDAGGQPAPRKNRMGQQARRALWEKKYGSGANHVQKAKKSRDNGWDTRRGATDRTGAGGDYRSGHGGRGGRRQDGPPQRNSGTRPAKPEDNTPLHPSWEAARKAKEQKSSAAFEGKKVVFD